MFSKILNEHFSGLCKCDYPKTQLASSKAHFSLYYAFCVSLLSVQVCIRFPAAMMQCFLLGVLCVCLPTSMLLVFFVVFFCFWLGDSSCKLCG